MIELTFADEDIASSAVGDGRQAIEHIPTDGPTSSSPTSGCPSATATRSRRSSRKSANLHIPVLLLAGAFEPVDQARARRVGCDSVLVKPFEPQS